MTTKEPRNPFYLLLLLASMAFAVTAVAYAVVPFLEERALAAGRTPPPSAFRSALGERGWVWLLFELGAMFVFGIASMVLDRVRSLRNTHDGLG